MLWLLGARPFLTGERARPSALSGTSPRIGWALNDHLGSSTGSEGNSPKAVLIPTANRAAMGESLQRHLTPELFLEWVDDFAAVGLLDSPLAGYPDQFAAEFIYSGVPKPHGVANRG